MRNEETLNAEGVDLLAYWRLGESEAAHAARMLEILDLPFGACVVDLGAGTGHLAKLCYGMRVLSCATPLMATP